MVDKVPIYGSNKYWETQQIQQLEVQDRDQLLHTARHLVAEAEALSARIRAVNEISVAINRTLDLEEILHVVGMQARSLLEFDHCSVCLREENVGWRLVTLAGKPFSLSADELAATTNLGYVLHKRQARIILMGSSSPYLDGFKSQILIPLISSGEVLGAISFAKRQQQMYSQEDLRIGNMLAMQLASAIRNAEHVTALKRIEGELRHYAHELEDRNEELDTYAHTIAHDLKTPLSAIRLKAQIVEKLGERGEYERARSQLHGIVNSADDMTRMIEHLLWLARLRDTREALQPVYAEEALKRVLARFTDLLRETHITIRAKLDLPPVLAHPQWIEEVFANLISNAIKYMGDEQPNPEIRVFGTVEGNNTLRLCVADNGVGIAPEDQVRLFEMFTRLETAKAEGTGLGLSIVSRIVRKLDGKLGVESEWGKGSCFWFTLPIIPEENK